MKKKACVFIVAFFANAAFAAMFDDIAVGFDFLPVKYELAFAKESQPRHEISVTLGTPYFENWKTGFGINYRYLPKFSYSFNERTVNFLGILVYWDVARLIPTDNFFINHSIFGPCFSADYLNWNLQDSFIDITDYTLKIGVQYIFVHLLGKDGFLPLVNFESGYKITNGTHGVYFSIQIGLSALAVPLS